VWFTNVSSSISTTPAYSTAASLQNNGSKPNQLTLFA
jgi:hypothetical protein